MPMNSTPPISVSQTLEPGAVPDELLPAFQRLRDYLALPGEPDERLNPRWLAARLGVGERELLGALAYGVRDGLVELHWEVYCPECGLRPEEFSSLAEARGEIECVGCAMTFDLHLDRDVRVTFSATVGARGTRDTVEAARPAADSFAPTRGLDLLLVPAFRELFGGDAPAPDESLRIGRVAILFTDLRGSTAMYAACGDPRAYQLVRDHFAVLAEEIAARRGTLVKTIGDAVMASFASGADAVRAAFAAQTRIDERARQTDAELILKAGVHAGACLAVTLNGQIDFFGGAVNTAARVQGLSHGADVIITDPILDEIKSERAGEALAFHVAESFHAPLRGLPAPIPVHRLLNR
ncbi:MAG: adenylate/guanylate cyclase domain-containing protein [Acidobacteriota bacterium]|nr:adenylate/guanylate cyclase domain-containing protein [Acidobacteriota bacterium]